MATSMSFTKNFHRGRLDSTVAERMQSQRFLSSCNAVCPVPRETDQYGRQACPDTLPYVAMGCSSAVDRIDVENATRPLYLTTVDVPMCSRKRHNRPADSMSSRAFLSAQKAADLENIVGHVGLGIKGTILNKPDLDPILNMAPDA